MAINQDKLTVPEIMPLVRAFQSKIGNGTGGNLHIVLDDGNVDDDDVIFCLEKAKASSDQDGVDLATKLLTMSKDQRLEVSDQFYDSPQWRS